MPRTLRPRLRRRGVPGRRACGPILRLPVPYVVEVAPSYEPAPVHQAPAFVAQAVQRGVCYVGGCYHLAGDGVTTAYQWVWVPSVPVLPPGPPTR